VSVDDPGFAKPTKPIGRYLPGPQAALMMEHGQSWQDRGERGWRRVVASPEPLECLDSPAAVTLLNAGYLVVCAGGGGIPVVSDLDGTLRGIEAVVDKDLTAALLALSLAADRLIIATDVEQVVMGWASQAPRPIGQIRVSRLRELADRGEFASGSMGPKVEAACRYAESSGRPAVITSLERIRDALRDSHGTVVLPDLETPASEGELGA
jgi:carbamate kinase